MGGHGFSICKAMQFRCLIVLQKNQCFIKSDRNHVWFERATVRLGVSLVTKRNKKDRGAPSCASPGSPGHLLLSALLGSSSSPSGSRPAAHLACLSPHGAPSLRSGRASFESKHSSNLDDKLPGVSQRQDGWGLRFPPPSLTGETLTWSLQVQPGFCGGFEL